ncbi:MAG: hypothetical protein R6U20_01820 [Longimonas sp.]|uniref:hypothetical protein n=1 Tax=Longimonas sp. TaxID=2039626 RepID=UPI003975B5E7
MLKSTRALITFALLIGVTTGCDFLGGSNDAQEVVGFIGEDIVSTAPLAAPDTVQAGTSFDVTVTTFGPNLCWQASREEVEREPMRVSITPYDKSPSGDAVCADAIAEMERTVSVTFEEHGEATIVVNGRDRWFDDPEPKTLTHTVIVE